MAIQTTPTQKPDPNYGVDPEMQKTMKGYYSQGNDVRNQVAGISDAGMPDWVKQGQKAYFADKSYTPEQRAAIITRARRGIPLRARTK